VREPADKLNRSIDIHACRQHHVMLLFLLAGFPTSLPFDSKVAFDQLERMKALLVRHLRIEDERLYPLLEAAHDTVLAARAVRYSHEMGGLHRAFEQFCERWNAAEAIAHNAGMFLLEWAPIGDLLCRRIEAEETDLYPQAETYFGF
jgi:hemerythrin-like domain-containing protein